LFAEAVRYRWWASFVGSKIHLGSGWVCKSVDSDRGREKLQLQMFRLSEHKSTRDKTKKKLAH
jgi:hypothetical protein